MTVECFADVESCTSRLKCEVPQESVYEFAGGIIKLLKRATEVSSGATSSSLIKDIKKNKDMVIIPSDKSQRLVAVPQTQYDTILHDAFMSNNQFSKVRTVTSATIQSKFNRELSSIAQKYETTSPEAYSTLMKLRCSTPTPSSPYVLAKDHKEGPLKGRPIVAAVDSASTDLSKFLSSCLDDLLIYVPAHLRSSETFISWVKNQKVDNNNFGSLDVINLYGNIPRIDGDSFLSIFTVLSQFLESYACKQTILRMLSVDDSLSLVKLALNSEFVLYKGDYYRQTDGLAMGSPLAPQLAIIYMNHIENVINEKMNFSLKWKRYIDDIFVIWPHHLTTDEVLKTCNSVSPRIQFTFELATSEGCLPFLDCEVVRRGERLETRLFSKSTHSGTIFPWNSNAPTSTKRAVLLGELHRAFSRSTNPEFAAYSRTLIIKRFENNGYPIRFIKDTIRRYDTRSSDPKEEEHSKQKRLYVRMPFVSEAHKRQCLSLLRRTGLSDRVTLWFDGGNSLRRIFHPPKERQICDNKCKTCPSNANGRKECLTKHVIYEISCSVCSKIYIGESSRIIKQRILEHMNVNNKSSAVVQHFLTVHADTPIAFNWKVIHRGLYIYIKRLILESHYISNIPPDRLMNGCTGRNNSFKFNVIA